MPFGLIPINAEPAIVGLILHSAKSVLILSEAFISPHFFFSLVVEKLHDGYWQGKENRKQKGCSEWLIRLVQIFKCENCHYEPAEGSAVIPESTTKIMNQFKWSGIFGVESGRFRCHTSPKADIFFLLSLVEIQMHVLKLGLLWICTQISKDRILVQMGMLKSPAHIFISLLFLQFILPLKSWPPKKVSECCDLEYSLKTIPAKLF